MEETTCTYLCPMRSCSVDKAAIEEFEKYFKDLRSWGCEVIVVDGSPQEVFDIHATMWTNCWHMKVDPQYQYLNGKVNGILTAVPQATHEKIILGDDDIRYTEADIHRMVEGLEVYDVVRPQNYFDPHPAWAQVDSARILLNRAFIDEGDFPGTYGFRKSVFLAAGEFDGDVLFDNEELVKHLENRGANISYANNFFVLRKPATKEKWLEQRPRQAYEDFVMRKRTAFFLSVIPAHLLLLLAGKKRSAGLLALSVSAIAIAKAFKGRKNGAGKYLPKHIPFLAPLWVLERSVSIYLALYWKITKGGYPFGDKIISKGTGRAWKK